MLLNQYYASRNMKGIECSCKIVGRCFNPLIFSSFYAVLQIILQFTMLGCISGRMYADNFFSNTTAFKNGSSVTITPKEGSYTIALFTWLVMLVKY